jgi:hypothetical protein
LQGPGVRADAHDIAASMAVAGSGPIVDPSRGNSGGHLGGDGT